MKQTRSIFICTILCSITSASICAVEPKKEDASYLDWNSWKSYFTEKIDGIKKEYAEHLETTEQSKKDTETLSKWAAQLQKKVDGFKSGTKKIINTVVLDPIKTLASGPKKSEDPKKIEKREEEKKLIALKEKLIEKEREELLKKLKPHCTDGRTPDTLLELIYQDDQLQAKKKACEADKTEIAKKLTELESSLLAGQETPRSTSKTALLATGSLLCGVSAGLLTYMISKKLLFKNCSAPVIKRKRAQLKNLITEHDKLNTKVVAARAALKNKNITAKKRESAKKFLENNAPALKKLENKIFWRKINLFILNTKNVARNVGIPLFSAAAGLAATAGCVSAWPSIWPATTPPQVDMSADKLAELKNSCATLKNDYENRQKEWDELDKTDKTMTHLPIEAQHAVAEWKSTQESLKNFKKQAEPKDTQDGSAIGTVTGTLLNNLLNPPN